MNRFRLRDETGLAGQILVGVIAWALGAVHLLTNTLVAAQQIDNRGIGSPTPWARSTTTSTR